MTPPDLDSARRAATFSETMFSYNEARNEFEKALCEAGFGDFEDLRGDDYDNSIELDEVGNDERLGEAAQRVIFDAGFSIAFVNHKDGWETHYGWKRGEPFAVQRGWRRRYVEDPSAITTNVIAGPPRSGYYEISYWPDGWGDPKTGKCAEWLSSRYMRIVPDDALAAQRQTRGEGNGKEAMTKKLECGLKMRSAKYAAGGKAGDCTERADMQASCGVCGWRSPWWCSRHAKAALTKHNQTKHAQMKLPFGEPLQFHEDL